ncbi:N-acetylneuraminic acid outer membrane channel protein [Trabulsiella guamensis ATCC 49490]|uniref:N-acetylneuraminic acid outer membrane channel protein n=1 Tax=Trabulsiella guamensis ATCC 49490 TaxID=1005994 RepID=A0A085A7K7_9ENTR|nr:oligogalacturonate-specific porin KdgM family protein [Trabulsiella guamensis]KFC06202.1 N-acetylneuraminic acid outer membrane channel protein [Trabulsiella guamensis ATCC 49490]
MKKLATLLLAAAFCPLVSQAVTLDIRGGYREGSHKYESRFKMSQAWSNGFWLSMETDNKQGVDGFDQSSTDYNEIEGNYKYKLTDTVAMQPGMVYHWGGDGAQIRPYVKFVWNMTPATWSGIRFRYDWNQYDSTDLSGNQDKASVGRVDLYFGWQNDKWYIQDNPVFYRYVNDFNYNNDKQSAWENDLVIKYKLSKVWQPYIEWDYMGQQGSYQGRRGLTENRYRVGISINI